MVSKPRFGLMALALSSALAWSLPSSAYELDTHFYATYAMARYAGIKHDAAQVIAASAQWPDETEVLGSPMVPELGIGTKMRRLFHFPCKPITVESGAHSAATVAGAKYSSLLTKALFGLIGETERGSEYIDQLNVNCMTTPADEYPVAYNMLYEGLREGNLIKASTAIHTIEDSFAHAGTPSSIGHSVLGHQPDRPFTSPDKFRRMVRAVMTAMVAIRANLPDHEIDRAFHDPNGPSPKMNYEQSIDELADGYRNNPYVQKTYRYDMYKHPELVRAAVKHFLLMAQRPGDGSAPFIDPAFGVIGWFNAQFDLLNEIDQGENNRCEFPGLQPDGVRQPTYFDCILAKVIERLIAFGSQNGLQIVDKYAARSLIESYPQIAAMAKPFDERIAELKKRIRDLKLPSAAARGFDAKESASFSAIQRLQSEIAQTQKERREALAPAFDQYLAEQIKLSGKSRLLLVNDIVQHLTEGYIPRPLGDENRFEFENEGELRQLEFALRVRNARQMIHEIFGDYVQFVENAKAWSYPKARSAVQNLPFTQTDVLPLPGEREKHLVTDASGKPALATNIKYVTLNYRQIDLWIETMVRYLFPDVTAALFPSDRCTLIAPMTKELGGKPTPLAPALSVSNKNEVFTTFASELLELEPTSCGSAGLWSKFKGSLSVYSLPEKFDRARLFVDDFVTTHLLPDAQVDDFGTDQGIQALFASGQFKPFTQWNQLTPEQADAIRVAELRRFSEGQRDESPYHAVSEVEKEEYSH